MVRINLGVKKLELTKIEVDLIYKALVEYENNYYMNNDDNWQDYINTLIEYIEYIKK